MSPGGTFLAARVHYSPHCLLEQVAGASSTLLLGKCICCRAAAHIPATSLEPGETPRCKNQQ